jgi:collagenase-like PrtC family protease
MISEKIFCLPFNGDVDFAIKMAENYDGHIYEFYGDDGLFSSGRHGQHLQIADLEPLVSKLSQFGVKFNYTLNSPNLESYLEKEEFMVSHLKKLRSIGVQNITVTHPVFVKMLKDMGFQVSSSAVQCISSIPQTIWAEKIGFERIVIAEDINRCLNRLRDLVASVSTPIEIIINNVCILNCPWRMSHYALDGIINPLVSKETWERYNKVLLSCRDLWKVNPVNFLRATWMRPEEIMRYRKIGVKYIKLVGRDWPSERLQKSFEIYISQEHRGFVFDYLKPGYDVGTRYGIKNLKNKDLDEYFNFFFDNDNGCDGLCVACNHCESYAKRLFYADND